MQVMLIHLQDRPHPGFLDIIQELQDEAKFCMMMLTWDHKYRLFRFTLMSLSFKITTLTIKIVVILRCQIYVSKI